jgi:hypothetical protein
MLLDEERQELYFKVADNIHIRHGAKVPGTPLPG